MNLGPLLAVFGAVAALIAIAVAAMGIGVMFRRPCLRGSCGGPDATAPDGTKIGCANCPNRGRR